ncbi:hypothetical protein, partial [Enterobacter hormaechei]|uniref:hypothetical protein n=1 Tax=Enterobacter hormaechei TaxID=158836 RepID=UPI0039C39A49
MSNNSFVIDIDSLEYSSKEDLIVLLTEFNIGFLVKSNAVSNEFQSFLDIKRAAGTNSLASL